MYLSKKAKNTWLRKADDRSVRFAKKLMQTEFLYPLLVLTDEPMRVQELLENGVARVPFELELLGFTTRERGDDKRVSFKLTKKGLEVSLALKQLILTIEECLPEEEEGGPGKTVSQSSEGFI